MTARMTAREVIALHAAIEARRRELGLCRWQVAVEMDLTLWLLQQMSRGVLSDRTRERAQAWLQRHSAPPPDSRKVSTTMAATSPTGLSPQPDRQAGCP